MNEETVAITEEVAGIISDEIGERLRHEGGAERVPLAINARTSGDRAYIFLADGRHLRILVELVP